MIILNNNLYIVKILKFTPVEDYYLDKIFKKFPLFEKIGKVDFGIKLWILLKGIQAGDGKSVLITSLGHKPCIAMLAEDKQPQDILDALDDLVKNDLVTIPSINTLKSERKFVVTFATAHELNKIMMSVKLVSYLDDSSECRRFIEVLGFDNTSNFRRRLANEAKNGIFWLNEQNGLATAKFIMSVLLHRLMKLFPLEFPE